MKYLVGVISIILTFCNCSMSQEKILEKDKLCYVIRFSEPFVKREYGVEYKKRFQLLDVCPIREKGLQYPGAKIPIERDGKILETQFDILKTFADEAEARDFAEKNGLTDTPFLAKNDCEIIRIIDFPLTKRPNTAKKTEIALLNTCIFDETDVQRPSINILRSGKEQTRLFEVIKVFANKREAEKYVKENKLFDVNYNDESELGRIDAELTKAFYQTRRGEVSDEIIYSFKKLLKEKLKIPLTFEQTLFNLENEILIKTSPDKRLKFYSWDLLSGGTSHEMSVFAQFKDENGEINVTELKQDDYSGNSESIDFLINKIYEIKVKNQTQYLTFGWGTHGGGHQFDIVQIFKIADGKLVKDNSVLPEKRDLRIIYPRAEKSELVFNSDKNEISYPEFIEDKDSGFFKFTGRRINQKLILLGL